MSSENEYVTDAEMIGVGQAIQKSQVHENEVNEFLGQFTFRVVTTARPVFFPIQRRFLFRPFPIFFSPPFFRLYPGFDRPIFVNPLYSWRFRITFFVAGYGQCSTEVLRNDLSEAQAQILMQALVGRWSSRPLPFPVGCSHLPWPPNCVRIEAYQHYAGSWRLWRAISLGPGPCP